jgi:phosphate-selective porin OprO/OprP
MNRRVLTFACVAGLTVCLSGVASAQGEARAFPTVSLGGRIMLDAAVYDSDDVDLNNGAEFRRARLFAKGKVDEDWFYKFQYDFTESGSDGLKDVYIGYAGLGDNIQVLMGHTVEAGSLEDTSSTKYITFMERALPVLAFEPAARRLGVRADTWGDVWSASLGVFEEEAAHPEDERPGAGASSRLTFSPVHEPGAVWHAGLFGAYRRTGEDDTVLFRTRPEAHVDDTRLVGTGPITNAVGYVTVGVEAAWVGGPWSVQGEWIGVEVDREDACAPFFSGYYLYASWFLTGESRSYDQPSGTFGRVAPRRPLAEDGIGAWELALRYSCLDLQDDVRGGEERNVTAGVNWYTGKYTRFMLNYVNASVDHDEGDIDAHIVQVRTQVDF